MDSKAVKRIEARRMWRKVRESHRVHDIYGPWIEKEVSLRVAREIMAVLGVAR